MSRASEVPDYAVKIVRLSSFAGYISGREQNLPLRMKLLRILLEKSASVKEIAESIDGISYVETYNSIYFLERHGIVERSKSGNTFSIAGHFRSIVSAIVGIYDLLVDKLGEDKARNFFFTVFQNVRKMAIMLVVYTRDGITLERLYDLVEELLSRASADEGIHRIRFSVRVRQSSIRRYTYSLIADGYILRDGGLHVNRSYRDVLESIIKFVERLDIEAVRPRPYIITSEWREIPLEPWRPRDFLEKIDNVRSAAITAKTKIEGLIKKLDSIREYMGQITIENLMEPEHIYERIDIIRSLDNALGGFSSGL